MSGTFLDLWNTLVTIIFFPRKNSNLYFVLLGSVVFISTRSITSLCPYFVYLRDSPILKVEFGVLVCVESVQTIFDGLTIGLFNLCDTDSLITSSLTSGVKYIALPVLGSYLVYMDAKEKLNVEYF